MNRVSAKYAPLAAGMAFGLMVAGAASAQDLDHVVYGTASNPGLANAAFYLAESHGYFEEEGIEVETVQFAGTSVLLPQIANRSIDIGYPIPDFLVISHDVGNDPLPLKYFYNVNRLYNWEIIVPADSDIETLEDLEGAVIGVNSLSTGNVPVTRSMLRSVGLEVGEDVDLIATPQGAAAINALRSGQIDALNLFDAFHAEVERAGVDIRRVPLPERYQQLFGNSFAAHNDMFEENPDLLVRFGRAYSRALVACHANPEVCVTNLWEVHPATRPTDGDEEANLAFAVETLMTNLGFKLPEGFPDAPRFGNFGATGWNTLLAILLENGTVTNENIDLSALYTNEFVDQFGDFDLDEVIARAQAAD